MSIIIKHDKNFKYMKKTIKDISDKMKNCEEISPYKIGDMVNRTGFIMEFNMLKKPISDFKDEINCFTKFTTAAIGYNNDPNLICVPFENDMESSIILNINDTSGFHVVVQGWSFRLDF